MSLHNTQDLKHTSMLGDPILFFNAASFSDHSTKLQLTEMQLSTNGCILHYSTQLQFRNVLQYKTFRIVNIKPVPPNGHVSKF